MQNSYKNYYCSAMLRLQTTFKADPAALKASLTNSPLLAVLRPNSSKQAQIQVAAVAEAGFTHVELSWNSAPWWAELLLELQKQWPHLRFGAAGISNQDQLPLISKIGIRYAMAPVASAELLITAADLGITLVPGVFSPTEIRHFGIALASASGLVKLFPAASLGPAYWRQLKGPLSPLPFCIAAGGIAVKDVPSWFDAGVQAVALGSSLFDACDCLWPGYAEILAPFVVSKPNNN